MTIFEKIAEAQKLRERLQSLQNAIAVAQRDCKHRWGEPEHQLERYQRPVFSHFEPHGSDPIPHYDYIDQTKSVWVRQCTQCGLKQQTEKTKPTAVGPDFD